MALTKIKSEGIKDGEVKNADMADDAVGVAELSATGTASSSTFLRGDNSWATPTDTNTVTTINNNADNRVITGSGTANTLEAESGLTYNGSTTLTILAADQVQLQVGSSNAGGAAIALDGDSNGDAAGGDYSLIRHNTDGDLEFYARSGSGATNTIFKQGTTEKLRIQSGGGISFNGDTAAANALDDYEEGTWTPSLTSGFSSISYHNQNGFYTKIGNIVHFSIYIYVYQATGASQNIKISLPFTSASDTRKESGGYSTYDNATLSSSWNEKSGCAWLIGNNESVIRPIKRINGTVINGDDCELGAGGNNRYFNLVGMMYV